LLYISPSSSSPGDGKSSDRRKSASSSSSPGVGSASHQAQASITTGKPRNINGDHVMNVVVVDAKATP